MKIAKLNNVTNIDHLFDIGFEPQLNKDRRTIMIVDDDYIFSGATDITSISNWVKYNRVFNKDYIWIQRRIEELRISIGWSGLTNTEKDYVIYYNQMKTTTSADTENTLKAIHLISTGQVAAENVSAYLRKNHAESVGRAKKAARERVDSDKLVELMIAYLKPHDLNQLMDTMAVHLRRYKDYVLIGTIIYGNEPGLWDYINSQSIYSGAGLVEEGWTTLKDDLTTLRDKLNDLLWGDNNLEI